MDDLVSIIVPIYNSEKFIKRCMDSLVSQTYRNIEIIAIDDGSCDHSLEVIRQYSISDERIKIFTQPNQGPSVARNTGIDKSRGDYIMFVDIDDFIHKEMVRYMVRDIVDKENTLVLCDNSEIWIDRIDERKVLDCNNGIIDKVNIIKVIASGKAGLVCGKLFSKSIIDKYDLRFDKDIKMCEDQIFFLSVSRYCNEFIYVSKVLYHYDRRNENSITIKYQENAIENQIYVINRIEEILNKSDLDNYEITLILNNRLICAINYCISNEILDAKISNVHNKISNIKDIIQTERLKEAVEKIYPSNKRENMIIKAFKKNNYIAIFGKFYALDRIVSPSKRYLRKLINV